MNKSHWLNTLTQSPRKKPLPFLSFPGIQVLGLTVTEMLRSPDNQARCMKAIADRFCGSAAVTPMDLSVEAEAFGCKVAFRDFEVPTVTRPVIFTDKDALSLRIPKVGDGRTGVCVEAVRLAKSAIPDRPVLAGVIGPFSLSGRLMGMTEIMVNCLTEPDMTHATLMKATAFITQYAIAMKKAGADGVIFAEPAAGLLSPALCRDFSSIYIKDMIAAFREDGFPVIYHNCGNTLPLLDTLLETGADAYHFGDAVNLGEVLKRMPGDLPVLGNLSPAEHLQGGTPQSVAAATRQMLSMARGYRNYIPSSGCDIPPAAPLGNIDAFFKAAMQ